MDIVNKYFPNLSDTQKKQFSQLGELYANWNTKINVISRKDIENIYERHVLHSLGIAKIIQFKDYSCILDVGTGGGFPGIPLAILFPNVKFQLIDSIGKKIQVATEVSKAIGLTNVSLCHKRAEQEKALYDFVISRAVMRLDSLIKIVRKNISPEQHNALPNGVICLKGGDLEEEIKSFSNLTTVYDLSDIFEEQFFETKKVIHVVINNGKK